MSFIDSATFVYLYCAVVGPIVAGIGIWAHRSSR